MFGQKGKRKSIKKFFATSLALFLLFAFSSNEAMSQELQSGEDSNLNAEAKILELSEACRKQQRTDIVCNFLVTIRQVGDDAVEAVKAYADLSEDQYKALTIINVLVTGRFRLKYKSGLTRTGMDTIDIQRDQFSYTFEDTF